MSIRLKLKALSNTPVLWNSELHLEAEKYLKGKFFVRDVEEYLRGKMNLDSHCPIVGLTLSV